jgi:hypothetical protein
LYRAAIIHGLIAVDDLVEVGLELEHASADREKARSCGPSCRLTDAQWPTGRK